MATYLSEPKLVEAWSAINERLGTVNIPLTLWRSANNPAAPILSIYEKFDQRFFIDKYDLKKELTVAELEYWTKKYNEVDAMMKSLEATYGQRKPSNEPGKVIEITEPVVVIGKVPFLHKVLFALGAGLVVYATFKKKKKNDVAMAGADFQYAGGASSGMRPSDFNRLQLRRGLWVELEHTCANRRRCSKKSKMLARRIAMDHLSEDPKYYKKLFKMHLD